MKPLQDQSTMTSSDHDLIVRLSENVNSLRDEMRQITAAFTSQYADHEARMRVLEAANSRLEGANRSYKWILGVVTVLSTVLEPFILWFLNVGSHK